MTMQLDVRSPIISPYQDLIHSATTALELKHEGPYGRFELENFVTAYVSEANRAGINPIIPLSHAVFHSDWLNCNFAHKNYRNPTQLGFTGQAAQSRPAKGYWYQDEEGTWWEMCCFANWVQTARAHIGRLLALALPYGSENTEQARFIAESSAWMPIYEEDRGAAPTLEFIGYYWGFVSLRDRSAAEIYNQGMVAVSTELQRYM